MIALALFALTGCDAFTKARDTLDGLLEPVVVQGIVLGIEPPQGDGLDELLANSRFEDAGTSATIFLADAANAAEIETAPISGATVQLTGSGATGNVNEADDGVYTRIPDGTFPYVPEAMWELVVQRDSPDGVVTSTAQLMLPVDADQSHDIPSMHQVDVPIQLDFTGLEYDAAIVVVMDQDGVAFSNEPSTIREVYDFTRGNADLTTVEIPGDVFDSESLYLVGVAGLVNTRAGDLDGMNTGLSSVMIGKMRFYPVSTIALPDAQ